MATVLTDPNQYDPSKEKQEPGQVVSQTGGPTPPQVTAGTAAYSPAPTSSGRFTNIQKYIQASRGPGQMDMGGRLSGRIGEEAESVRTGIRQQAGETAKQQQEARQQYAGQLAPGQINPYIQQTVASAQQLGAGGALTPEQVQQFRRLATAQFGGPQQLVGGEALAGQVQNVRNVAQLAGTTAGQQSLLQQYYGRPTYTAGQKGLDLLLMQTPEAQRQLAQARTAANIPQAELTKQQALAAAQGQTLTGEAKTMSQQAQQAATEAISSQESDLASRLKAAQESEQNLINKYQQDLRGMNLTREEMSKLGLSGDIGMELYGVKPSDYFRATGAQPTTQTIATPEDFARYQALTGLAGQLPTTLTGGYSKEQAWTPEKGYQFDKEAFEKAAAARKAGFESEMSSIAPGYAPWQGGGGASPVIPGLAAPFIGGLGALGMFASDDEKRAREATEAQARANMEAGLARNKAIADLYSKYGFAGIIEPERLELAHPSRLTPID